MESFLVILGTDYIKINLLWLFHPALTFLIKFLTFYTLQYICIHFICDSHISLTFSVKVLATVGRIHKVMCLCVINFIWVSQRTPQVKQIHEDVLQTHSQWVQLPVAALPQALSMVSAVLTLGHSPSACSGMCHTPFMRSLWSCWEFVFHELNCSLWIYIAFHGSKVRLF